MKNSYPIVTMGRMYFLKIEDALVEVKFVKAKIDLQKVKTIYTVLLPDGSSQEIISSMSKPMVIYNSAKDYEEKKHIIESRVSLKSIACSLNVQESVIENGDEEDSFEFYVWVFEKGFAQKKVLSIDVVSIDEQNKYTTTTEMPKQHYPDQRTVEKLYKTKVLNADGTQSHVGGELSTLFLSAEQKEVLKEWEVMAQKLKDANIMIVHSENTGQILAVNAPDVNYIYGSYDIDDAIRDGAIELSMSCLQEFYVASIPLMCCEDRENDSILVQLKVKSTDNG